MKRKELEIFDSMYGKYFGGARRVFNKYVENFVDLLITNCKNHFGIEIRGINTNYIINLTQWIKKYDPKFEYHVAEADEKALSRDKFIDKPFIVKLDKGTFMYVDGQYSIDTGHAQLVIYIFGKKYQYYNRVLKKYMSKCESTNSMLYTITASNNDGDPRSSYWTCTGTSLPSRSMDTLYFNKGIKETILNHIQKWLNNEETYLSRGLMFKTGILVYGAPGTGKSSLAVALANYLKCGLIMIDMSTFGNLNISEVTQAIVADHTRYVVLLDEIDIVFTSRDNEEATDKQISNTSKLLSFLDSSSSPNNVVFIATTNYIDRLDNALLRKGRFDLTIELGQFEKSTAIDMCKGFGLSDSDTHNVLKQCGSEKINPATLQDSILSVIK